MTFLAAWVAFPLLALALSTGAGLLVERIGGSPLPATLRPAVGFAALVCVTQITSILGVSVVLAPAAALLVAVAGFVLGDVSRPHRSTLLLGLVVFLAFAAPALFTGEPTFLGYQNLGDASIHFEIVDRWMHHGPSTSGLAASNYRDTLNAYFDTSYPTGSHTVLGAVRLLLGIDVAWVFQPYLVVLAVLAGLGLHALVRPYLRSPWAAAAAALASVSAGLVYSYAQDEQALKELATIVCIVAGTGLVAPLWSAERTWRAGLPMAVVTGGAAGVLSLALAPWFGPLLLAGAAGVLLRRPRARGLVTAAGFVVAALVLSLPALSRIGTFVHTANGVLTGSGEAGNLGRPLEAVQAVGAWPAADFRFPITGGGAYVIVGGFALAALLGLLAVVRRGAWPVVLFFAVSVVAYLAVSRNATPWADGKALMILSPAVVLLAACGAALARRAEGLLLAALLGVGLVWTDAESYHGVDAAPYDRLSELARIGEDYAGRGPALYFEFEEFAKYFLRRADPMGAADSARPDFLVNDGTPPRFGFSSDVDAWSWRGLTHYRLLVTRRGPAASRPPGDWKLDRAYRFYDVWARAPLDIRDHLHLGGRLDAAAVPSCAAVRRLSREGGRLAYVARPRAVVAHVTDADPPRGWAVDPGDPEVWRPHGPGQVGDTVDVPEAGRYRVWIEGSFGRGAHVSVDGREVGVARNELEPRLSALQVGTVSLSAGRHQVGVYVGGGSLDPRNGGYNRIVGPVSLVRDVPLDRVREIRSAAWHSLCGRSLDWLEAVA